ncbi:MAG: DUF2399 domain-containing protein [Rhodospirillales bacterium]|nr:DUF2399 domain-containing protein [Rhodospirillales bacterium]
MARIDDEHAAMAERVLRAGARGWRRWSTLRRNAGPDFSPLEVELELLDDLCRKAGVIVEDGWRNRRWQPDRFTVDRSIWPWLDILDPDAVRAELEQKLTDPKLLAALAAGPPPHVDWRSFAFVLQAADRVLELGEHGVRPGERELAGLVDHTRAWTRRRRLLLEELLGGPFAALVAPRDRQLGIKGPISHGEANIWASAVATLEMEVADDARGVILVENAETFRHLVPLAEDGWIVVHVPGGPPPAEADLVRRLAVLVPDLTFYACFDPDPAGIRIARLLEEQAGVSLDAAGMRPEFLLEADHQRKLNDWDRDQLRRLAGQAGAFEPLRATIERLGRKGERETYQRRLLELFETLPAQAPQSTRCRNS